MMGGKVGLADNLTIGNGAMIAAGSGVISDVPAGERWAGYPAASEARVVARDRDNPQARAARRCRRGTRNDRRNGRSGGHSPRFWKCCRTAIRS